MGFAPGFVEHLLSEFHTFTISDLCFILIRAFELAIFRLLGLSGLFSVPAQISWPPKKPESASIIQDMLPVMKFSDIAWKVQHCVICLYEFKDDDEIRRLRNCTHMFHRWCVDRWMEHDQNNCPVCRTPLVPYEFMQIFHDKLEAASISVSAEFDQLFCVTDYFL
ncbi:unnamed protein product [Amaranthus hypochondriacus]